MCSLCIGREEQRLKFKAFLLSHVEVDNDSTLAGSSTADAAGTSSAGSAASALADPAIDQVDSYIVISADGTVTTFTSRLDLGQGVSTGYLQIMAEELDVPLSRTNVVLGDTGIVPDNGGMGGSGGTTNAGIPIRRAAAAARAKLLSLAAARFGVTVDKLTVKDGVISVVGDPTKSVTYAELIAGKRFDLKFDDKVVTKPVSQYKIVGQPIARVDIPGKLTGEQEYVHDVRLPGMVHARAVRPRGQSISWLNNGPNGERGPYSTLLGVDEKSVADVKGLIKVVPVGDMGTKQGFGGQFNFVGVVCEREEQAIEASRKLKVTWATTPAIPADLYAELTKTPAVRGQTKNGDVDAAMATVTKKVEATYKFPFQMHASIGSACAVADVKTSADGKVTGVTIWTSAQGTYGVRSSVGSALGIPTAEINDRVKVIWRWGPGGYGGSPHQIPPVDAALLSRVVGRPVRVQWFREDTHGWEAYGPLHLFNLKAGLDSSNRISAYDLEIFGSGLARTSQGEHYSFARQPANYRVVTNTFTTYFMTSALRAPSQPATTFAVESFLDELAAAAKVDPVDFRLKHLDPTRPADARVIDVINAAADKFGWVRRPSPNPANANNRTGVVRGRGIAYAPRDDAYVAVIMEVEVNQSTGVVRLIRAVAAQDLGLIINPESIKQQIEGNVIQTSGRALWEEVTHDGRRVNSLDWQGYQLLRMREFPKVESVLVNRPQEPAGRGSGEAAAVPVPAAIGNAIFDATGVRVRQVPLTPERMKAALAQR